MHLQECLSNKFFPTTMGINPIVVGPITGGIRLRNNILLEIQKKVCYLLITAAIILFVLSLGFMTNFYQLFYNGTTEMLSYYKQLQYLNKAIFNASVIFIVISLLLIPFDINKKSSGKFGLMYVTGIVLYILITSLTLLSSIPYYRQKYLVFDFSNIQGYNPSTFAFSMASLILIILTIFSVILLITVIINFIKGKRELISGRVQ